MSNVKLKMGWGEVFIGVMLLLGGVICILIPAAKLEGRFLVVIILGITGVMLGTTFIWKATEGLRKRQREGQEIKDHLDGDDV